MQRRTTRSNRTDTLFPYQPLIRLRLVLLRVDVLERGEIDDGREREALPDRRHDRRRHCGRAVCEPGDAVIGEAERQEEGIDEAELGVVQLGRASCRERGCQYV